MPKTVVITMNEQYPFFMSRSNYGSSNNQIFVRKLEKITQGNQANIRAKASFIKNLRNKNLIKVENLIEEDNQIHIYYENVESKYDWRNPQILTEVYNQLKNFTTYLSNIGVKASLKSNRIGLTDKELLKFYLGLDFQWDLEDDEVLQNFYQGELKKLFGSDFFSKSNFGNQVKAQKSPSINQKPFVKNSPSRKISIATISSRQDRFANLEKEMNMIKSSYEKTASRKESTAGLDQTKLCNYSNIGSTDTNQKDNFYRAPLTRDKNKLAKKWEDRKFSGDIKNHMMSTKKLQEKESDIKSQKGNYPTNRLKQRFLRENNMQQIETVKSKSKMEEMKYQQYIQIKQSQKNYLKDFISVLQDDNPSMLVAINNPNPISKAVRFTDTSSKIEDTISLTAQALRLKTQEAIFNSRKIINKVKGFPGKSLMQE